MHATTPLSSLQARRLAQWHAPRMPDEGQAQYRRRIALQVRKLLQLAGRPATTAGEV